MNAKQIKVNEEVKSRYDVELTEAEFELLEKEHEVTVDDMIRYLDEGDVHFTGDMTEMMLWQNDDITSCSSKLEDVLNLSIDEEFLKKYNEAKCENIADYMFKLNSQDYGTKVQLSNSVIYIYG